MKNTHTSFATGSFTAIEVAVVYGATRANSAKLARWDDKQFNEEADRLAFFVALADELDTQADWEATHDWYLVVDETVADLTLLDSANDSASIAELVRLVLRREAVQQ